MAPPRADFFRKPIAELGPDALVARFLSEFEGAAEIAAPAALPRRGPEDAGPDGPVQRRAARREFADVGAAIATRRLADEVRLVAADAGGRGSLDLLKPNSTDRPCGGGWLVSASSGLIVAMSCGSWRCPRCAKRLRACAATTIREGYEAPAFEGRTWGFFTLTDRADATLDLAALGKQWNRTNAALRRDLGMTSYALAVEVQKKRGALHVHVLAAIPDELWPLLRPPKYLTGGKVRRDRAQYAWHFGTMVPLAERLGWGQIADAEQVHAAEGAAGYMVKALAGYLSKDGAGLESFAHERVRPFRTSADWPVRFSEVCARRPADADPGPWQRVEATHD